MIMFLFPPVADTTNMIVITWPLTDIQLLTLPLEHIVPIALIFGTFVATSFFGGFAEILTQRVLLDVIPNRIRNSMYSLTPTIAMLFAIPQIALFGWLITIIGFPLTLMGCGVVSLVGVILISHGLNQPTPIPEGETWASPQPQEETEDIEEIDISGGEQEEVVDDMEDIFAQVEDLIQEE
jgi:hypothetical protein